MFEENVEIPDDDVTHTFDDVIELNDEVVDDQIQNNDVKKPNEEEEKYSQKVQKRIDKLTAKNYQTEAELQAERKRRLELEEALSKREQEQLNAQVDYLRQRKIDLMENGEFADAAKVDDQISDLRFKTIQPKTPEPVQAEQPVQQSEAEKKWLDRNDWWFNPAKKVQQDEAIGVYQALIKDGFDPTDDDFYEGLEARLRPAKGVKAPTEKKPLRQQAPGGIGPDRGNAVGSNSSNQFTQQDADIMRRWGLNPDDPKIRSEYLRNKGAA